MGVFSKLTTLILTASADLHQSNGAKANAFALTRFLFFLKLTSYQVIQRKMGGSVSFNRTWQTYKEGFGKADGEYWLGKKCPQFS